MLLSKRTNGQAPVTNDTTSSSDANTVDGGRAVALVVKVVEVGEVVVVVVVVAVVVVVVEAVVGERALIGGDGLIADE